jgi:enamine deaminase RidA (YjgF/YER057c/UK114 family)
MKNLTLCLLILSALTACNPTPRDERLLSSAVQRFDNPDAQILRGVRVPANQTYFYTSGIVAAPMETPTDTLNPYGDTYTQSLSTLRRIETILSDAQLQMKDVIFLRIYLVADPNRNGQIDFDGWFRAYQEFFNNDQNPNKVARTTLGVAALARPELLVEIEAVAIYP